MLDNDTRPGPPNSIMAICPVNPCPWRYKLTEMEMTGGPTIGPGGIRYEHDDDGTEVRFLVPAPEDLSPDEVEAVLEARRRVTARMAPGGDIYSISAHLSALADAQDDAMCRVHLLTQHTDQEVRAALDGEAYALLHRPPA